MTECTCAIASRPSTIACAENGSALHGMSQARVGVPPARLRLCLRVRATVAAAVSTLSLAPAELGARGLFSIGPNGPQGARRRVAGQQRGTAGPRDRRGAGIKLLILRAIGAGHGRSVGTRQTRRPAVVMHLRGRSDATARTATAAATPHCALLS